MQNIRCEIDFIIKSKFNSYGFPKGTGKTKVKKTIIDLISRERDMFSREQNIASKEQYSFSTEKGIYIFFYSRERNNFDFYCCTLSNVLNVSLGAPYAFALARSMNRDLRFIFLLRI